MYILYTCVCVIGVSELKLVLQVIMYLFVGSYRDSPGIPIKCTFEGQLKDLFQGYKPKQQRKMYYQQVVTTYSVHCTRSTTSR